MGPLPVVSTLPLPAQVVFVAAIAVIWALVHFGVISGRKAKPQAHGVGEIVALTVDSSAIQKLTGEVSGLAVALHELTAAPSEQADNTDRLREELKETGKHIRDVGNEITKAR